MPIQELAIARKYMRRDIRQYMPFDAILAHHLPLLHVGQYPPHFPILAELGSTSISIGAGADATAILKHSAEGRIRAVRDARMSSISMANARDELPDEPDSKRAEAGYRGGD